MGRNGNTSLNSKACLRLHLKQSTWSKNAQDLYLRLNRLALMIALHHLLISLSPSPPRTLQRSPHSRNHQSRLFTHTSVNRVTNPPERVWLPACRDPPLNPLSRNRNAHLLQRPAPTRLVALHSIPSQLQRPSRRLLSKRSRDRQNHPSAHLNSRRTPVRLAPLPILLLGLLLLSIPVPSPMLPTPLLRLVHHHSLTRFRPLLNRKRKVSRDVSRRHLESLPLLLQSLPRPRHPLPLPLPSTLRHPSRLLGPVHHPSRLNTIRMMSL